MTDTCRPLALHALTHHIYYHTADTIRTACSSAQRSLTFKSARSPRGSISSSYGINQQRQNQRDQQALLNSSLVGISTAPGYLDQAWASITNSTTTETAKLPSEAAGVTTSQTGESSSNPSSPGSCTCTAPCIPFSPTREDFTTCVCRDNAIQPDVSSLVNLSNNPSQYSLGHYDSNENGSSLSLQHKASRASLAGAANEDTEAMDEFWNKSTTRKPAPAAEWDYEALMSSSYGTDQDMDCDHTTSTGESSSASVEQYDIETETVAFDRVWSGVEQCDTVAAEMARKIMSQRAAERLDCVFRHLK